VAWEEEAEREIMFACEGSAEFEPQKDLLENLPRRKVAGPCRKFQVVKSVHCFEHSWQWVWKGFFLVTSKANLILNESMAMKSSWILSTS
jgi:hypothetical protein